MKETPIFEEIFHRLIKLPDFWVKLLIGGLLSFVPIVNLFAFGYLYRLSHAVRKSGQPTLPNWSDWSGLFMDGLRFAVVWLAYWLLPVLIAALITKLLAMISLGALTIVVFLTTVLISTVLFNSALYRFNMRQDFNDLLDVQLILRMTWMELPRLIVPAFVFLGLFVLLLPFYGFAFFGGFLMLITFTSLRYRSIEQKQSISF
ncbi:MAG: hypothetical protein ACI9ZV_000960 [Candidatus Azotimanducaceae bacterium]|jgi:hypothetical protein